jgi:ribosomal protein L14
MLKKAITDNSGGKRVGLVTFTNKRNKTGAAIVTAVVVAQCNSRRWY